jgi:N utilization substance protein A
VAAQTARQVIQQRIREAERQAQLAYYDKQLGEIVSGVVQAVNAQGVTIGLDMKAEGTMPRKEMIPGERFRVHERARALVYEVKDGSRGPQIMLSRAHRNFLRRLLENEVPEIYHGVVEIRSIAREPGERAKVAVAAMQQGIDPVGACVGIRGVRIQAIVRELHDEKIDVIEWNPDPAIYIAKAISPARVSGVYLNDRAAGGKTATVVVPEDQLSLAIGRDGQNARLAAKLTSWRIDIKSLPEAVTDTVQKLKDDSAAGQAIPVDASVIQQIEALLLKKAEGRPLSPEEYDQMTQFVDRIERKSASRRQAEKKVEENRRLEAMAGIPEMAFKQSILDSGLSEHVGYTLQEAGYLTVGDLLVQVKLDMDVIFALQGIGPKAMQEIQQLVTTYEAIAEAAAQEAARAEAAAVEAMAAEVPVAEAQIEAAPVQAEAPIEEIAPEEVPAVESPIQPEVEAEIAAIPEEGKLAVEVEPTIAVPVEEVEEELPASLDEIFALKPETLVAIDEVEEEEESDTKKGKKKKKKSKHVEVVYDPDRDLVMVKKKHKRGGDWGEWE